MQLLGLKPAMYSPQSLQATANDHNESKRNTQERKLCNGKLYFFILKTINANLLINYNCQFIIIYFLNSIEYRKPDKQQQYKYT